MDLRIEAKKQSDIVSGLKHLLSEARSGKIVAIGYAVVKVDDDGDLLSGTNAVWTDDFVVKDALKDTIETLSDRVSEKTKSLLLIQ